MGSIPTPGSILLLCALMREAAQSLQVSVRSADHSMCPRVARGAGWCPCSSLGKVPMGTVRVWAGTALCSHSRCSHSCTLGRFGEPRRKMSRCAEVVKRLYGISVSAVRRWNSLANKCHLGTWDSREIRTVPSKGFSNAPLLREKD